MKGFLGHPAPRGYLRRFADAEGGNVAIVFAAGIVVLMLAIGAAVDVGRWMHARSQTIAAVDAAVLAGGRTLQLTNGDKDAAITAATNLYKENVKSRLPVIAGSDSVTFTAADNGLGLNASGNAYIATPFLGFAKIDKLPLVSLANTKFGSQIGMKSGQTEISMMLDVTGSMCMPCSKLQSLKDSAQKLVDIVTAANESSKFKTKVAIVPFSEDIRLPTTAALNAARGTSWATTKTTGSGNNKKTYYISDCVVERTGSSKYTDDAPAANKYVTPHYQTDPNVTGSGSKKRGTCTIPSTASVQPLTSDTNVLSSKISQLSASGGTAGHLGTAWAWYTLSPNWNSLWPADNQAQAYALPTDKDELKKVAILMTDGDYNTQYDANGIAADSNKTSNCTNAGNKPDCSTQQAQALCTAMKAKGIEVWTVGFDVAKNSLSAQTLKSCASDDTKYYNAADGDDLISAFTDIAVKLTTVYLSK